MEWMVHLNSMEDTEEDKYLFCPLTEKECSEHCMWNVRTDVLSDDGINNNHQCAVVFLLGEILENRGFHEEEDEL